MLIWAALLLSFQPIGQPEPLRTRVLVVANSQSPASLRLAREYVRYRGIPRARLLALPFEREDTMPDTQLERRIREPIRAHLRADPFQVDYIVLIRGVPWLAQPSGLSVDGTLVRLWEGVADAKDWNSRRNPYYEAYEPFRSKGFGMYLVNRLDGYSENSVRKLIQSSLQAAPYRSTFHFEGDGREQDASGFGILEGALHRAALLLREAGFDAEVESTRAYRAPPAPLMGYAGWGSNDAGFRLSEYRRLQFRNGSLAETFVSTSGRTFRPNQDGPLRGGQSLAADLVENGVAGIRAYVSEPFTISLARPDVLFERYIGGRNLAESLYAASPVIGWKEVVLGDPLCRPYRPIIDEPSSGRAPERLP
jgi:uncharacterized protein (TIGR03790 family)